MRSEVGKGERGRQSETCPNHTVRDGAKWV